MFDTMILKKKIAVVFNAAVCFVFFRARAEAEEARQKAKEDDDVGVWVHVYVCIGNSQLDITLHALSECC